jgi:AcrR family transcriptional regulator
VSAVQVETRRQMIDATVACILERGFYRASTNEIARRAGVTWGVIQHHFGTREALLLAVLQDGAQRFAETVEGADIVGDTAEERLGALLDILADHYGRPEYMAWLQVMINMDHDPRTSDEVRATMREVAERSSEHVRRLLGAALGPATRVPDLATTMFLTLRGIVVSQQLLDTMAYDTVAPQSDRIARQRQLLVAALAPFVESIAATRG